MQAKTNPGEVITYFVQAVDGGPIKIGRSHGRSALPRLGNLQIGNPSRLVVTRVIDGNHEKALHHRFAHLRLAGEWFIPAADIAEIADAIPVAEAWTHEHEAAFADGYTEGWQAAVDAVHADLLRSLPAAITEHLIDVADSASADATTLSDEARRRALLRGRTRVAHAPPETSASSLSRAA